MPSLFSFVFSGAPVDYCGPMGHSKKSDPPKAVWKTWNKRADFLMLLHDCDFQKYTKKVGKELFYS